MYVIVAHLGGPTAVRWSYGLAFYPKLTGYCLFHGKAWHYCSASGQVMGCFMLSGLMDARCLVSATGHLAAMECLATVGPTLGSFTQALGQHN